MHNYIINDRVLFNTHTGTLSRLDDPRQISTLDGHAKRLFLRLIDSGYQIVPFDQLAQEIHRPPSSEATALLVHILESISESFLKIREPEPILTTYSYGVQLSTDVELKVIASYRTFNNDGKEKPYIAKRPILNATLMAENAGIQATSQSRFLRFIWYYIRGTLLVALFITLLYGAQSLFSNRSNYYADYHYQGDYSRCKVFIHNQKPTDLARLKQRIDNLKIDCSVTKNVYFSLPADDRRESFQVCQGNPDKDDTPCVNYYVVKVK